MVVHGGWCVWIEPPDVQTPNFRMGVVIILRVPETRDRNTWDLHSSGRCGQVAGPVNRRRCASYAEELGFIAVF